MNRQDAETVRARLEALLRDLDAGDALGAGGQATVELDQQAMGRLSRQDALMGQSMARAGQARRDVERRRLRAALARLEAGDYGDCELCGEAIAPRRLELDPAAARCVDCAASG